MQAQTQARTALPGAKIFAAAAALLMVSVFAINAMRAAHAAPAFDNNFALPSATTIHSGMDWSQVAATPADTGATVGAYDR